MAKEAAASTRASRRDRDFLVGQMLIAMPNMADPRFERSVLVVCAHDADHAMAIIVNKPLEQLTVERLLAELNIESGGVLRNEAVRFGGPVQTDRGLVMHSLDYESESTIRISPHLGLTATRDILVDIAGRGSRVPPLKYFLAVGYAGWGPGQIESEIAMNAWAHCDIDEELIFGADADAAWSKALERLGVTGAMLSPEWSSARTGDRPLN